MVSKIESNLRARAQASDTRSRISWMRMARVGHGVDRRA